MSTKRLKTTEQGFPHFLKVSYLASIAVVPPPPLSPCPFIRPTLRESARTLRIPAVSTSCLVSVPSEFLHLARATRRERVIQVGHAKTTAVYVSSLIAESLYECR